MAISQPLPPPYEPSSTSSTASISSPLMSNVNQPQPFTRPHSQAHTFNPDTKPGMAEHRYPSTSTPQVAPGGSSIVRNEPGGGAGPAAAGEMNEWNMNDKRGRGVGELAPPAMVTNVTPLGGGAYTPAVGQGEIHWYRNAAGHTFSSPLPPSHPAMQCLLSPTGAHLPKKHFGFLGLIMGVVLFPLGCIWTALDNQVRCQRCGEIMDTGCYSQ